MASAPARATDALSPARLTLAPGANLIGLLAAIDDAPGARVFLDAANLPRALQTRTILTVLRRQADRRGKRLHLVTPSQTLWRLARLAELEGVAASEAAATLLLEPLSPRMPHDAVPAVVIDTSLRDPLPDLAPYSPSPPAPPPLTREREDAVVPKNLSILARNELDLEPIPALDKFPAASPSAPDLPAPTLASLVAWLDVEVHPPATGGGGPGGPEGPGDDPSLPGDEIVDEILLSPTLPRQSKPGPRRTSGNRERGVSWVTRVGAHDLPGLRGAVALRRGSPTHNASPAPAREASPYSRLQPLPRSGGRGENWRSVRTDTERDRVRDRASRRSLNRDRLDRLAGRGRAGAAPGAWGSGAARVAVAATEQIERVRRLIDGASQHDGKWGRTTIATMAVSAVARAIIGGIWVALGMAWRLIIRIRLTGAQVAMGAATVLVATMVALFTWYVLPSATVEIVPAVETWSTTVPIIVDPAARKADPIAGRIPGRWIVKEATESGQANATGKRVVPDGKAGGDAVFVNRSDRQIAVPKGTIVSGVGVRFVTQSDIAVPPTLTVGPQKRVGVGRVQVVAEVGGTGGNLDRGKISGIEGSLAGQLDVQNDQQLRGGTERTVVYVTADDRKKLLETVRKGAIDKLAVQVKSLNVDPAKEIAVPLGVVDQPVTIPGAQGSGVIEATFSKGENDEGASVSVTVKARYAVTVFETAAAQIVAQTGATTMLAQQRPGFAPTGGVPRTMTPDIGSADPVTGQVRVRVRVDAAVAPVVAPSEVRAAIAGRTPDEARMVLARLPGVASYRLEEWPAWPWKQTLPALGWRIGVTTANSAPAT